MRFRAWPRSLAARTAVVLLVGLALVQVAGLTIHGLDRVDMQRLAQARDVAERVVGIDPEMGGEDFGQFGRTAEKVPICMFRVGAVDPVKFAESQRTGAPLPSLHSSKFAPLPEPAIKTGVTALTAAALDLLTKK